MVGSRKLSNDEVEALLSGLDEESTDEAAQQFDPNEVREFKFGTEDLSLLGDYYALRMINEKICRFTRSVFLPMLRIMPRISSFPPEVKSFDEYVESCDNFVSVTNSRIEELRGNSLLVIENHHRCSQQRVLFHSPLHSLNAAKNALRSRRQPTFHHSNFQLLPLQQLRNFSSSQFASHSSCGSDGVTVNFSSVFWLPVIATAIKNRYWNPIPHESTENDLVSPNKVFQI